MFGERTQGSQMNRPNERKPIRRRKLADEVRERILESIDEQSLAPGDTLSSEREMMDLYGVGRPAIREAMQSLQAMGLITVRHGERPRVAQPTLEPVFEQLALTMHHVLSYSEATMAHLKEVRLVLEARNARIAAVQRTESDLADLSELIASAAQASDDVPRFLDLDEQFHERIAMVGGNPILSAASRSIFQWLRRFHIDMVRVPGLERLTLQEHEALLHAIEKGDPDLAESRMVDHLNRANVLYQKANLT
ncbi:transcriptional regulator NanR [Sulfitobacter sp. D35]|uniref:transcriptional regulator NanR n=1 Tax=Sulfitobacter sp. D35 TaxID=3083252 RepID=UPI00296EE5A2|nr:transcriptional regulator NanR [Sulfitobacter sp. D35]MDW4499921.1 transcriptional regulator NanR [Sulfitobacter sp. D35]